MIILTACLSIYGATAFQTDEVIGVKTLSGREISRDPVQSSEGWAKFTSGWLVGGLSGVAWSVRPHPDPLLLLSDGAARGRRPAPMRSERARA